VAGLIRQLELQAPLDLLAPHGAPLSEVLAGVHE
jgi:hypothetical protein